MQNRIRTIGLPVSFVHDPDWVSFMGTTGISTYAEYCECASEDIRISAGVRLIKEGYIMSLVVSEVMFAYIGVTRKGLMNHHRFFEKLKIAKVFPTSSGYLVILGKKVDGIDRFFLGDTQLYDNEVSKIEKIYKNEEDEEPRAKVIKRKKIKVVKKVEATKTKGGSLEQLRKANEKVKKTPGEYKPSIDKRNESKINPSLKSIYNKYKKKDVEAWGCEDFLGYYLNEYVDVMGSEDVDFINFPRTKARILLMNMGKFKKIYFTNNNEDFKNYIRWAMEYINDPSTWITSAVSIYSIVISGLSKNLIKEYLVQKTRKKVKNRVTEDSEYSEEDYWQKKYSGKSKF